MEGIPTGVRVSRGIKGKWWRKGYEQLNGRRKRKVCVVQLGHARRRRLWRIKLAPPRLKLRLRFSPKKFLLGLRDAYVSMMMKIGGVMGSGYGGDTVMGFGVRPLKEYDERMIVEIYKSILTAQGQLVPRDAAWVGSGITCQR